MRVERNNKWSRISTLFSDYIAQHFHQPVCKRIKLPQYLLVPELSFTEAQENTSSLSLMRTVVLPSTREQLQHCVLFTSSICYFANESSFGTNEDDILNITEDLNENFVMCSVGFPRIDLKTGDVKNWKLLGLWMCNYSWFSAANNAWYAVCSNK